MVKKKITERLLRDKSESELKQYLATLEIDVKRITVEKNARRLKNVSLLGQKKKEIAKVLTIIHLKELSTL